MLSFINPLLPFPMKREFVAIGDQALASAALPPRATNTDVNLLLDLIISVQLDWLLQSNFPLSLRVLGLGTTQLFSDKETEAFGYWLKHEVFWVHLELDSLEMRL